MKTLRLFLLLFLTTMVSCTDKTGNLIHLENSQNVDRPNESFVIKKEQLNITDNTLLPLLKMKDGTLVPCQTDDMDGDGKWDELAFVYNFSAKEKVTLRVEWVKPEEYPKFERRTNVHFGKMVEQGKIVSLNCDCHGKYNLPRGDGYPYQMDGIAWENDKIGFRHYFDGQNCRDVFGKRTTDMVLDTVGIRADGTPGDTYHVMSEWGRDIMSAANSFGLGGLAVLVPDSLVRLGVTIEETTDNVDSTCFKMITKGPVRSVFSLDFYGWEAGRKKMDLHQDITIWAGKYGYENKIKASGLPDDYTLVTGIVRNFNDNQLLEKRYDEHSVAMVTHDKQTYDKVWYMGMGLIIPYGNFIETFDTPDAGEGIISTWCVKLKPDENGKIEYKIYAAWEVQDERFRERNYFVDMMDKEALSSLYPISFRIQ